MRAHLYTGGVRIRGKGVDVFDLPLGSKAVTVRLQEAPEGVEWLSSEDPVLDIRKAKDGKSATITPTDLGTSIVQLQVKRGERISLLMILTITVFEEETTRVTAEFTNVRLKS